MSAQQLLALIFGGIGLLVLVAAFGATVMWRVVHLPGQPLNLPVWVASMLLVSAVLWIVAAILIGQSLFIVSAIAISMPSVIHLVQSLRHRSAGRQ